MLKKLLITTVLGVTLILNAEAIAKCEQGSHNSINYIKRHYKNCTQCREEVIPAGKCAKVKGKHKHYYCMCDVCDDNSNKGAQKSGNTTTQKAQATAAKNEKASSKSKSSGSCSKQGSHTSIDWIKKKYKNCGNCGTQKGSKGETVYYCYCGDGCGASIVKTSGGKSTTGKIKDTVKGGAVGAVVAGPVGAVAGAVTGAKKTEKEVRRAIHKVF